MMFSSSSRFRVWLQTRVWLQIQEWQFYPGPVRYFPGDWWWNILYGHSSPFRWFKKSYGCLVTVNVLWLFHTVPWFGLRCVIVVFPDHTHLLFAVIYKRKYVHEVLDNPLVKLVQKKVWLGELTVPTRRKSQWFYVVRKLGLSHIYTCTAFSGEKKSSFLLLLSNLVSCAKAHTCDLSHPVQK